MIWLLFVSLPLAFAAEGPKLTAENLKILDIALSGSANSSPKQRTLNLSRHSAFEEVKSSLSSSRCTIPKVAHPIIPAKKSDSCDFYIPDEDSSQETETVQVLENDCNQDVVEKLNLAFNENYSEDLAESFYNYYTTHQPDEILLPSSSGLYMERIRIVLIFVLVGNLLARMIQK